MRIHLKTHMPENQLSYRDVGFVTLHSLLQDKTPLLGFSIEVNHAGAVTGTHYLYTLAEDEKGVPQIERYPLRCLVDMITVMKPCARSKAITHPFTPLEESVTTTVPALPKDAQKSLFSEKEREAALLPVRDAFSKVVDVFQDKDSSVVNSIFNTLFSAGFVTHRAWQSNLELLSNNQNKLEEIASALFALHEVALLTQKTFTAVVNHDKPWANASALRNMTHPNHTRKIDKKIEKIRTIPFRKAQHVEDDLFSIFPIVFKTVWEKSINTVMQHPSPEEAAEISILLIHTYKLNPDLRMFDALAKIKDPLTLKILGATLFFLYHKRLLSAENCLALLNQSEDPLHAQSIFFAISNKLRSCYLALTQSIFNAIMSTEDPRLLVAVLSNHRDHIKRQFVADKIQPIELLEQEQYCNERIIPVVALFEHLAKAGLATRKNLKDYGAHSNHEALARLLGEVMNSGVAITQTIFNTLCVYPEPTNKSAVEILALTPSGRNELRHYLTIEYGKFLLGSTEISPDILAGSVDNKTIREWLSIATEEEFKQKAQVIIDTYQAEITTKKQVVFDQFIRSQLRLFPLRREQGVSMTGERRHSDAVTPVLQNLVYGQENEVKSALESVKHDPQELSALLCDTGTVTDYSNLQIKDTLFKAALRAGDIEMCQMLTPYFELIPNRETEFAIQFVEVFPNGIDAYDMEQQQNAFDFSYVHAAIEKASRAELDAALKKIGAQFIQSDDAREKPDDQLTLAEVLNRFREQFSYLSQSEKTFNPHHLLHAFRAHNILWEQCISNHSDQDYAKRNLFWCQIIGYVQRFVPACYAQAFVQGVGNFVKGGAWQRNDWRPKLLERSMNTMNYTPISYYPLFSDSCSGLGFDFGIATGHEGFRTDNGGTAGSQESTIKNYVEQKRQVVRTCYDMLVSMHPQM